MEKYTSIHHLYIKIYFKKIKSSSNCIQLNIFPSIINDKGIVLVIDEIFNDKDFEQSGTEIENFNSIEEVKHPQEYEDGGVIILDDLNAEEINDP